MSHREHFEKTVGQRMPNLHVEDVGEHDGPKQKKTLFYNCKCQQGENYLPNLPMWNRLMVLETRVSSSLDQAKSSRQKAFACEGQI